MERLSNYVDNLCKIIFFKYIYFFDELYRWLFQFIVNICLSKDVEVGFLFCFVDKEGQREEGLSQR